MNVFDGSEINERCTMHGILAIMLHARHVTSMKFLSLKWTYMTTSDAFANEAESPYVLRYIGQVIHH